jgi:hypothetical protein
MADIFMYMATLQVSEDGDSLLSKRRVRACVRVCRTMSRKGSPIMILDHCHKRLESFCHSVFFRQSEKGISTPARNNM